MGDKDARILGSELRKGFDDFVKICIYANRREFDALFNIYPMEYKMFKRLAELKERLSKKIQE